MGCISSKLLFAGDVHISSGDTNSITAGSDLPNHTVSLTSSTYGVLNLDPFLQSPKPIPKSNTISFSHPSPEIINWILADDPEDAGIPKRRQKSPPPAPVLTPSPNLPEKFAGKENRTPRRRVDPNRALKPLNFSKRTPEAEQIKRMVLPPTRNRKEEEEDEEEEGKAASFLLSFEEKCPPGGERAVVLYTTSLRGIRKTFEDCNLVRSVLESHNVCFAERDVSMDLAFREELRALTGEAKMPVLFVKGRMVGGAEEVVKLEEERKMEVLMAGIPKGRRRSSCGECGGMRFVMCKDCDGSCRVLDDGKKKKVKCGRCNENGLVYCSLCGG